MKSFRNIVLVVIFFLLVKLILYAIIRNSFVFLDFIEDSAEASLHTTAVGVSSFLSSVVTLLILYFWRPAQSVVDSWRHLKLPFIALLFLIGIVGISLNSFILSFFIERHVDLLSKSRAVLDTGILGIFSVIVLVPWVEEVVFRRVFIGLLSKEVHPWLAIFSSSLVFGVLHIEPVNILGATLLGLLFGWIYYCSKSILPSVLIHIFNNGFFIFSLSQVDFTAEEVESSISPMSVQYEYGWLVFTFSLAFFALLILLAYKYSAHLGLLQNKTHSKE